MSKLARKLKNALSRPHYHRPWGRCNVCGHPTAFVCDEPSDRWIRRCLWCRSTPKYRAIVQAVEDQLGARLADFLEVPGHALYELTTTSPICRVHHHRPNYTCSSYFSDRPFGVELRERVWNADVQALPFADQSFDLVVSSETFEHVPDPWLGFSEIYRVLRPGGVHAFTIPYRPDRATTARARREAGQVVHLLPPEYHQDPHNQTDSLVFTDFGGDLLDRLCASGWEAEERMVIDQVADIQDDLHAVRVWVTVRPASSD